MKKSKKSKLYNQILGILFLLYAAGFGFFLSMTLFSGFFNLIEVAVGVAGIIASYYLSIIIHEGGHLVFGLIAGYGFSSFRIASVMWVKQDGRIRLRRFKLAGSGGQCLMTPPQGSETKGQTVLYNMGGVIANVILSVAFALLYYLSLNTVLLALIFLLGAAVSFFVAITNGIPFNAGVIVNDGMNAIQLLKDPDAKDAFRKQLLMNAAQNRGMLTVDMPDEWFTLSEGADMQNTHCASIAVFSAGRSLDRLDTLTAERDIEILLNSDYNISGLHRNLLTCDLIFCRLINSDAPDISGLLTPELDKFMRSMKQYPSILRTRYAIALLVTGDNKTAEKIAAEFDKVAKKHPYPCNIEVERGLIGKALRKNQKQNIK